MIPPWFNRYGVIFLPRNFAGWIISLTALAYAVYLFIDIESRSHSVSDTLINWVFNCFLILLVYTMTAYFTSRKGE